MYEQPLFLLIYFWTEQVASVHDISSSGHLLQELSASLEILKSLDLFD